MSSPGRVTAPEPLGSHHRIADFACGTPELDEWLVKHALQSQGAGGSRTTVVCQDGRVVGFHSLSAGSVAPDAGPGRVVKGMGRHPVPVVVLARLAVDRSAQGNGLGTVLLKDALIRVVEVSGTVGVRAAMVQAKDDVARAWYLKRAPFMEAPADPNQLFLLVKDIRATLGAL